MPHFLIALIVRVVRAAATTSIRTRVQVLPRSRLILLLVIDHLKDHLYLAGIGRIFQWHQDLLIVEDWLHVFVVEE